MYRTASRFQQAGPASERVVAPQRGKAPGRTPPNVPRKTLPRKQLVIVMRVMRDGGIAMEPPRDPVKAPFRW